MTAAEFAEEYGSPYTTVMTWLKRGLIPNAQLVEYPRGQVWEIPRSALKTFKRPKRGRRKRSEDKIRLAPAAAPKPALRRGSKPKRAGQIDKSGGAKKAD